MSSSLIASGSNIATETPARELADLIESFVPLIVDLDHGAYTADASLHIGTIGGHVRHMLDHVNALIESPLGEPIDYDTRQRDTPVENDPHAAVDAIKQAVQALRERPPHRADQADRAVVILTALSQDDAPRPFSSTFDRELAFVLSHTVHHAAMIAAIARQLDVVVPSSFGVAPSTLKHRAAAE